jgi:murein DD-endopeptidase MepM/ murein hydrolase activator NlpD
MKEWSVLRIVLLVVAASMASACATSRPVRNGRTGWLEALDRDSARAIRKPADSTSGRLEIARKGLLQGRESSVRPIPYQSPEIETVRLARWSRVADSIRLSWPVKKVQVTSNFGERGGDPHEGIDLRASTGTPVLAAHDGMVLYSGSGISGYGKLVVLKNSAGISTVYGHNSRLFVRKGQRIRRGQKIALSGSTGRSSGPHVHFEVRLGLKPVDPLKLIRLPREELPSRRLALRQRSTLAAAQRLR